MQLLSKTKLVLVSQYHISLNIKQHLSFFIYSRRKKKMANINSSRNLI